MASLPPLRACGSFLLNERRRQNYLGVWFLVEEEREEKTAWDINLSSLHRGRNQGARRMLTCFFCPNTKKHMNEITNQVNTTKAWWQRKAREIDADELAKRKAKQIATWDEEEWMAEPEQGVLITLVPQIDGSNYLKKIRFSEDKFNTVEAQKWWSDNYDKLIELYSIRLPPSPYQSDEDEDDINSIQLLKQSATTNSNDLSIAIEANHDNTIAVKHNSTTTCLKGVKGKVIKWVVEDEPGVYVTIRSLPDDIKEIVRVELSQERFGELNAREWWDENKARLLEQYL
ncbi:hypothetical protein IEQ34_026736 [Dendrobium chrysotoxum]|uniref:BRX domain-containing protein n=1 Tax=Dendrobium chrysotoxum TaxID=161865 RepID=A0AAV7FKY4_DENCH|nr:hypothetical protein IEQ34_026736 [Dendrobium chrysotoxum]